MKGRNLGELVAGAAVIAVAALFLVYAVTNSGRGSSGAGLTLQARFDRVDGLSPGAEVRIAGAQPLDHRPQRAGVGRAFAPPREVGSGVREGERAGDVEPDQRIRRHRLEQPLGHLGARPAVNHAGDEPGRRAQRDGGLLAMGSRTGARRQVLADRRLDPLQFAAPVSGHSPMATEPLSDSQQARSAQRPEAIRPARKCHVRERDQRKEQRHVLRYPILIHRPGTTAT